MILLHGWVLQVQLDLLGLPDPLVQEGLPVDQEPQEFKVNQACRDLKVHKVQQAAQGLLDHKVSKVKQVLVSQDQQDLQDPLVLQETLDHKVFLDYQYLEKLELLVRLD
jgi:hypothetical protein